MAEFKSGDTVEFKNAGDGRHRKWDGVRAKVLDISSNGRDYIFQPVTPRPDGRSDCNFYWGINAMGDSFKVTEAHTAIENLKTAIAECQAAGIQVHCTTRKVDESTLSIYGE